MENIELFAQILHEANRAYCISIGDNSQVHYEDALEWQKESTIKGIEFWIERDGPSASELHKNWCRDKFRDGWIFGPVKNIELKQHPCLIPYNELPREHQMKDAIFGAILRALYTTVG